MKKLIFILPIILFLYPIYLIIYNHLVYTQFIRLEMVAVVVALLIYNINSKNFYNNINSLIITFKGITISYLLIVPGYSIIRNILVDKDVIFYNLGFLEYTDGYLFFLLSYFTIKTKLYKNSTDKKKPSTD